MKKPTDTSAPKTESEASHPTTKNNSKLYKVEVGWRVVRIRNRRMIRRGNLGAWSSEFKLVVAESKERAKQIITKRYIEMGFETTLGVTPMNSRKEVKIYEITRLAQ